MNKKTHSKANANKTFLKFNADKKHCKMRAAEPCQHKGFTLVELSMVIVIIGLIAGSVIVGRALIRTAEVRAVAREAQTIVYGIEAFRVRYDALPGDMKNATKFWGAADTSGPNGECANPATDIGEDHIHTCNGTGNKKVGEDINAERFERYRFWQHLSNADLVQGTYTGVQGPNGENHVVPGWNAASTQYNQDGGWSAMYLHHQFGSQNTFQRGRYGNILMVGGKSASSMTGLPLFTPREAMEIDKKIDDGHPAKGKVITDYYAECTNATNRTDYHARYLEEDDSTTACVLWYLYGN